MQTKKAFFRIQIKFAGILCIPTGPPQYSPLRRGRMFKEKKIHQNISPDVPNSVFKGTIGGRTHVGMLRIGVVYGFCNKSNVVSIHILG